MIREPVLPACVRSRSAGERLINAAFADDEPGEPGDRDILAGPRVDGQDHVAHRLGLVLDEFLVEQDALAEPGVELALGDLLLHVRRLVGHLRHEDAFLLGDRLFGNVFAPDVRGIGGHDMQRQVLGKLLELLVAGDEVGLAVELDQRARLGVVVDVDLDAAGLGGPPGAELGLLRALAPWPAFRPSSRRRRPPGAASCTPSVPARSSCETR